MHGLCSVAAFDLQEKNMLQHIKEGSKQLPLEAWIVLAERHLSNKPVEQNLPESHHFLVEPREIWSHPIVAKIRKTVAVCHL